MTERQEKLNYQKDDAKDSLQEISIENFVHNGLLVTKNSIHKHLGYTIEPKLDFTEMYELGDEKLYKGYIITKDNILVLPHKVWFPTVLQARTAIECLIISQMDKKSFFNLLKKHKVQFIM